MGGRTIATAHELASIMTPEQSQRYGELVQAIAVQTASFTESGLSADAAAKVIAKAVTARRPRTRYTIGCTTGLMTLLARTSCPTGYSIASLPPLCVPTFPSRADEQHDSATVRAVSPRSSPAARRHRPQTVGRSSDSLLAGRASSGY